MKQDQTNHDQARRGQNLRNLRTGLILGSVALCFFVGVIVKHLYFK